MRLDNMVEVVRQVYPAVSRVQAIFDLNVELVAFARKSRCLVSRDRLYYKDDFIEETANTDNAESTWALPPAVYEVSRVEQIDREDWYVSGSTLHVRWVDSGVTVLDIEYSRFPLAISLDNDEPELPEEFHYAPVYAVLTNYASRFGKDLATAGFYRSQYREMLTEAKKYAHTRNIRNEDPSKGGILKKSFYLTGYTLAEGENTITMDVTFSTINSFSILLNGNGITVEEYDPNGNHDTRTTSSFKVWSATANTRFDCIVQGV
jgi:hypothetical protein